MPCGGIYPVADRNYPCIECNKPRADHFVVEWDAFIHESCIPAFILDNEEGQLVVEHRHFIQMGKVVLQEEGELSIMDPDVCLKELREAVEELKADIRHEASTGSFEADATKLIERFEALDAWLKRGGFMPTSWSKPR